MSFPDFAESRGWSGPGPDASDSKDVTLHICARGPGAQAGGVRAGARQTWWRRTVSHARPLPPGARTPTLVALSGFLALGSPDELPFRAAVPPGTGLLREGVGCRREADAGQRPEAHGRGPSGGSSLVCAGAFRKCRERRLRQSWAGALLPGDEVCPLGGDSQGQCRLGGAVGLPALLCLRPQPRGCGESGRGAGRGAGVTEVTGPGWPDSHQEGGAACGPGG